MFELYEKSIIKLELDRVLNMFADHAGSNLGKDACRAVKPVSDLDEVNTRLAETSAAVDLCLRKGNPGFAGIHDVGSYVERAGMGGCLHNKELLEICAVLRCTRNVKAYAEDEELTVLKPLFSALTPNKHLEDLISGAILSEEEIADNASSELAGIRRNMRIQSAKIKDSLQKIISSSTYSKFLRDPIVTIRQGRYVVPVKSECKNDVPGLVHDVSATGSTYFIEPMSAVTANNALRDLELQETKEIERILFHFSSLVAAHQAELIQNVALLVQLDVIFARARFALKMNAHLPVMNDNGVVELHNARHPLIPADKVVPITLYMGNDFDSMIITGPNTGGKTVTLKTIGLLTLMAECGLHIPAGEGSVLSTYDLILADIGDEQSISQNLSTFSSHMKTIVSIIEHCDTRTLVLFDELGAGTDPAEGAALAISLIEFCRKMGSNVVATTHYAELKLYAMRTPGVINASCEFNVDTLQPTYKLLIGIPGKSNAFAISRKLGLSEDILKNAGDLLDQNDKNFEDVLSQLEQQRQLMENARLEAEQLRIETEAIKLQNEEFLRQIQEERNRAILQAQKEAQAIIDDARAAANIATEEIKALKKQIAENMDTQGFNQRQSQLRHSLNEAEAKIKSVVATEERPQPSRAIIIGDTVELLKLGAKASVIGINKDGTYQLQAGILKMTVNADEIYLLENANKSNVGVVRPKHTGRKFNAAVIANEVDLRGMDSIEAISVMERYLDEAMRSNHKTVRVIHGKGTGVLRNAVHLALRKNRFVKSFRLGVYGEGEDGVTIVDFA